MGVLVGVALGNSGSGLHLIKQFFSPFQMQNAIG